MIGNYTSLEEVLQAKEKRVGKQQELLRCFPEASLISLSLNIPGALKLSHEAVVIFNISIREIQDTLLREESGVYHHESIVQQAGVEAFWACDTQANHLKKLMCQIEEAHPLGRLMDIDVINAHGQSLSRTSLGFTKRRCFICEQEAKRCARAQTHTYALLHKHINQLVQCYAWEESMALWCERAMRTEVELTPKPGLVDRANSGAHKDMDIYTFYVSIQSIKPHIVEFLRTARQYANETPKALFYRLREIGVACERSMFQATQGVNTHKGMIFCLALVCGALGRLYAREENITCKSLQSEIQALCEGLVQEDLISQKPNSAGMFFFQETGSSGIRGVAESGFEVIFEKSLPFFLKQQKDVGEEIALKQTLLFLMSFVDDSTLWSRGGVDGLLFAKEEAKKALHVTLTLRNRNLDSILQELDEKMIDKNLSPGGSADLLAVTWLLSKII